jgi:hypothetical protein
MTIEELRELARAAEPLSALSAALDGRVKVPYRDIVFRLLEHVAKVRGDLVMASDLERELRLLAGALPPARRKAEAAAQEKPTERGV